MKLLLLENLHHKEDKSSVPLLVDLWISFIHQKMACNETYITYAPMLP